MAWIPGHSGIVGNEEADRLARMSASVEHYADYQIPPQCFVPTFKNTTNNLWQAEWDQSSLYKGSFFHNIVPNISNRPWFLNLHLSKKETSTFTRLRLNHSLTPVHLHRFNIIPSNLCDCGEIADAEHILFSCSSYENDATTLYNSVAELTSAPFSLTTLLRKPNPQICKLIGDFIQSKRLLI